jgi:phage antirepressor YoqD-like protein
LSERAIPHLLTQREIMYRLGGEWMPYAQHIKAGRFVVKAG